MREFCFFLSEKKCCLGVRFCFILQVCYCYVTAVLLLCYCYVTVMLLLCYCLWRTAVESEIKDSKGACRKADI